MTHRTRPSTAVGAPVDQPGRRAGELAPDEVAYPRDLFSALIPAQQKPVAL